MRKENAALKAQLASASHPDSMELVALSDSAAEPPPVSAQGKTAAMKELAVDESLSEEARDSAKKALEVMVSAQLLDIEQTAALKKRAGALKELESEALFVDQQARIEVKQMEAEAESKRQKLEAKRLLQDTDELEAAASIAELLGAAYDTLQGDLDELGVESVEDLKELDEEDVEALVAKLKKVQAKKFAKKIAALRA